MALLWKGTSIMKRNLLLCGIVAGPLFIAISLIQAFTRTGFDLARHPISLLGLGSLGWVQIANFVVCGVLYVLGAVGLRSALQLGRGKHGARCSSALPVSGSSLGGSSRPTPVPAFRRVPRRAPSIELHGVLHEVGFPVELCRSDRRLPGVCTTVRGARASRLGRCSGGDHRAVLVMPDGLTSTPSVCDW